MRASVLVSLVGVVAISFGLLLGAARCSSLSQTKEKRILLIAGPPSHGPRQHEHNAGVLLLQKCLAGVPGLKTEVTQNGWPKDPAMFDGVDAVIIFADGGPRHI